MKFELQTLDEYSDEALLSELCRISKALNGKRLTIERFNSMARVHSTTLRYRFGSWRAALDRAGISEAIAPRYKVLAKENVFNAIRAYFTEHPEDPLTQVSIAKYMGVHPTSLSGRFGKWGDILKELGLTSAPLGRRYSEEECFENVLALWTHYGRQPHFSELKQHPSTVGPKAYIRRWGGWRAALASFVKHVNAKDDVISETVLVEMKSEPALAKTSVVLIPRSIGLSLRYRILSRDRFRCVTCGASPARDVRVELHVDHIIPWSLGGQNVEENLRTLCSTCNLGKGAKIEQY